jgi:hypothetical protein
MQQGSKSRSQWFSGHFHFGKYVDSMMQSRVTALATRSSEQQLLYGADEDLVRANIIFQDKTCQKYILTAMEHYAKALKLDSKHVYQALPRLLSLWFDFTSIQKDKIISDSNVAGSLSMNVLLGEYILELRCAALVRCLSLLTLFFCAIIIVKNTYPVTKMTQTLVWRTI